jgi:hypothetical protein
MISNTTWNDEKGKQRVMLFALPAGLAALKNKQLNLNFDGTFKCTPIRDSIKLASWDQGITAVECTFLVMFLLC